MTKSSIAFLWCVLLVATLWPAAWAQMPLLDVDPGTVALFAKVKNLQTAKEEDKDNPLLWANVEWPPPTVIAQKQIKDQGQYQDQIDLTWFWAQHLISFEYLPDQLKQRFILMPDMKRGDDWIMLRYQFSKLDGFDVQIIDGRTFTVLLKPLEPEKFRREHPPKYYYSHPLLPGQRNILPMPDESPTQDPAEIVRRKQEATLNFVRNVFLQFFDYNHGRDTKVNFIDTKLSDDDAFYGSISVLSLGLSHWLKEVSIHWWSDNSVALFDFEKMNPFYNPRGFKIRYPQYIVGGIAPSDPRSFIRFDPQRRTDLAAEFEKHRSELEIHQNWTPKSVGKPQPKKEPEEPHFGGPPR